MISNKARSVDGEVCGASNAVCIQACATTKFGAMHSILCDPFCILRLSFLRIALQWLHLIEADPSLGDARLLYWVIAWSRLMCGA